MATIISKSPEETLKIGKDLVSGLKDGDIVLLHGEIGAGKTQLVKGLAMGLNYTGIVTSPTFTLIHEYEGGQKKLIHVDLYRLESSHEIAALDLEGLCSKENILVIEWAERFVHPLSRTPKNIYLEVLDENMRKIHWDDKDFLS